MNVPYSQIKVTKNSCNVMKAAKMLPVLILHIYLHISKSLIRESYRILINFQYFNILANKSELNDGMEVKNFG